MESLSEILNFFKGLIVEYGLIKVTIAAAILIIVWRIPDIINALKGWH